MNSRNIFARGTSHFRFYRGKALPDFLQPKSHASYPISEYHHWSPIANRARMRRRARLSFLIALMLHLTAALMVSINLPRWYRPPPPLEPIVAELIEVELHSQRLHPVNVKKPILHVNVPAQPHATVAPSTPLMPLKSIAVQVNQVIPPSQPTAHPLSTTADLLPTSDTPFAEASEDDWDLQESISEPLESVTEVPQPTPTEVERNLSQTQKSQTDSVEKQSLNRDAQIGSVLQTIASGIASGKDSPTADIVFLLDTSGSMEDNIRAVGRHLIDNGRNFPSRTVGFYDGGGAV